MYNTKHNKMRTSNIIIKIPNNIKEIMQTLLDNNFEAYIIGGAIRDYMKGEIPHDYDIFTNATGKEILKIFPKGIIIGSEERKKKILTVLVDNVEISQYRKNGDRTEVCKDLLTHLSTCDFTINSIAMDINGNITDPNNGRYDIRNNILKAVGNPEERIDEDPNRVSRFIRILSKYNMSTCDFTSNAIKNSWGLVKIKPIEPLRDEFMKCLSYPNSIFNLKEYGFFKNYFKEIELLNTINGGGYHDENPLEHSENSFLKACKLTNNNILRMAIYLHDIGKVLTIKEEDGKIMFYGHDEEGAKLVKKFMKKLKFSNEDINYVTTLISVHMFGYHENPSKKTHINFFNKLEINKISIYDFILMMYCDNQGNMKATRKTYNEYLKNNIILAEYHKLKNQNEAFKLSDLEINGKDVINLGIKPGKKIGIILNHIFENVLNGELKNSRSELMHYLRSLTKSHNNKIKDSKSELMYYLKD